MGINAITLKIWDASPKAKAFIETYDDDKGTAEILSSKRGKRRYPWAAMKIGECFIESFENSTERKLNACCAFQRHSSGKRFMVIAHPEQKIYEVARIL